MESRGINERIDGEERVSLCVINHNGDPYLEESLGAALAQPYEFREVLLVDDASTDRSLEIVRDRFSSVRVLPLEENRGPAAARNAGFASSSGELVLFIDNDVILTDDCVEHLAGALRENPRAVVAMPRVLYADRRKIVQYGGADSHFLGLMILRDADRPLSSCSSETFKMNSVVTACFLLDRRRWGAGGPFDESFFIYQEDHDFGVRARIRGHELVAVPRATCFHRAGTEGLSIRRIGHYASKRVFCLIRNRWQVVAKNHSARTLILLCPALLFYDFAQLVIVIRKGWIREWLRAFGWMAGNAGLVLRKRKAVQDGRRTPDREILSGGPVPLRMELTEGRLERAARNALNTFMESYWRSVKRLI
jgi:GT2 family glycosyltransferase